MSEWTDQDTDNLFRRGSEQHDFEYDPAAWEQMEKLLGRDRRRRLFWWWGGVALLLIVLLLAGKKWQGSEPGQWNEKKGQTLPETFEKIENAGQDETPGAVFQNGKMKREEPSTSVLQDIASPKNGLGETKKQAQMPPGIANHRKEREAGFHQKPPVRQDGPGKDSAGGKAETTAQTPPSVAGSGNGETRGNVTLPLVSEEAHGQPEKVGGEGIDSSRLAAGAALLPGLTYLAQLAPTVTSRPTLPQLRYSSQPETGMDDDPADSHPNPVFLVGIGGGPELNSVGFGDFSRLNWKYGIHLEHRTRGRYALSLGANYVRMTYDAGEGEYRPTPPFWVNKIPPESTWGICDIVEVPVGLSYFPGGYERSGLFATVGLVSYFMLREEYWYVYDDPDPDLIRWWMTEQNHNYWFGIGSLAVGYNKWLTRKLALRAAPYLQFPLSEVGHGHVKLYSLGLNVRFDFQLTKN